MKKKLIHFGCSFAMGNGVPDYIKGIESGARATNIANKSTFKKKYGVRAEAPHTCGSVLAKKLGADFLKIADNGVSNEMIVRRLPQVKLKKTFVLIGLTSYNRREALTTSRSNTHWHTWKMVDPLSPPKYKDLPFTPWIHDGDTHYSPALEADGQIRTALQILYMQSFLKLNKTPYLMFNALYNGFDRPRTNECRRLLEQVDQKRFYKLQGSFDETQHGWCLKNKFVVSDLDEHPNVVGQREWADILQPLVKDIWNVY
jgi:hypothetical protein